MPNSAQAWSDITGWAGTFSGRYDVTQNKTVTSGGNTSVFKATQSTTFTATLKLDHQDTGTSWRGSAEASVHSVLDSTLTTDGIVAVTSHSETKGSGRSPVVAGLFVSPSDGTYSLAPGVSPSTTVESTNGVASAPTSSSTGLPQMVIDVLATSAHLPTSPGALAGSVSGGHAESGETWSITWSLTPTGTRDMTADIRVRPASPRRGEPVTLTAIVTNALPDRVCSWAYSSPDGHALSPDAGEEADETTIVLLEDVVATLTVSDADRKVVATRTITVAPRQPAWKVKVLPPVDDISWAAGDILKGEAQFGVTLCHACDGSHAIHHTQPDFSDVAILEQLDDQNGPHHGRWWVTQATLTSQLVCHVNGYLRSSDLASLPGQRASDVRAIQQQVHDHEHAHAAVCRKALQALDPSKALEAFVRPADDEYVRAQLQQLLVGAEEQIWAKTCDEAACRALLGKWAHPGRLVVKQGDGRVDVWEFPSMRDIGD